MPMPEPEPEWKESFGYGMCAVNAYWNVVQAPAIEDSPLFNKETNRSAGEAVRRERKRALLVHQLLERVQSAATKAVVATNECDRVWDLLHILRSTVAAAVRAESDPVLGIYQRSGWKAGWKESEAAKLEAELAGTPAPKGEFDDVCRAPSSDAVLLAPAHPGLPEAARAKLAAIEPAARAVSSAIAAQDLAFAELLPLLQGRDCRGVVDAYRRLTSEERQMYFNYRRKAVAGAIWSSLQWRAAE
jgi:hypothetical protein